MVFIEGMTFTVNWLLHNNGDCPVLDHLESLGSSNPSFQASAIDVLKKLREGKYHKMPYTKSLEGKIAKGILEGRVMGRSSNQLARYPFIYLPNRQVVLLYGFTKKEGKAPPKFVEKAKLYKELIENGGLKYEEIDFTIFQ